MVAFTITEINALLVSLFFDLVRPLSCLYLWYLVLWLRYLPCFRYIGNSENGIPKVIYHILVGAHQANIFVNKIFSPNSVLKIVRSMVLFGFFLKLGILLQYFIA